jgi:hypothetical protein
VRPTRRSTIDLFGDRFVLLAGVEAPAWRDAATAAARALGVPLEAFTIGAGADLEDVEKRWANVYGVRPDGAVLVRPDGHVAWRCPDSPPEPGRELERALARILSRDG